MPPTFRPLALATLVAGGLLVAIFAAAVVQFRAELRAEIRQRVIDRDAAVLHPVALEPLAEIEPGSSQQAFDKADLLVPVLRSARQKGMLSVAIFDAEGEALQAVPPNLLLAELSPSDYPQLLQKERISRFHPDFPLDHYFADPAREGRPRRAPVLEVLLRLHGRDPAKILGFAQYLIDTRALAAELDAIDTRINRQTAATLGIGGGLIAAVVAGAYLGLRRAQRLIAERNERLIRANFELTLSAKASAIGQITSNLLHGLQGPVAGLRAVVAARESGAPADWETAATYAERLQTLIQETVALLGDDAAQTTYELNGHELAAILRQRQAGAASAKGVVLEVSGGFNQNLDSHRGSLLCLIAGNLVQNAIDATDAGRRICVGFSSADGAVRVAVADEGHGIPESLREHLFEPGRTGRRGGSGIGLAISRLLSRQIGAMLVLEKTGPEGTTFALTMPLQPTEPSAES